MRVAVQSFLYACCFVAVMGGYQAHASDSTGVTVTLDRTFPLPSGAMPLIPVLPETTGVEAIPVASFPLPSGTTPLVPYVPTSGTGGSAGTGVDTVGNPTTGGYTLPLVNVPRLPMSDSSGSGAENVPPFNLPWIDPVFMPTNTAPQIGEAATDLGNLKPASGGSTLTVESACLTRLNAYLSVLTSNRSTRLKPGCEMLGSGDSM